MILSEKPCYAGIVVPQVHTCVFWLQVTVLESVDDPPHRLCLCTIHLYFHPMAEAVRLIQTAVSLRHIQRIKGLYESQVCMNQLPGH